MKSPKDLVPKFFDRTSTSYDKISFWTTFGKDRYWKKKIVEKIPNERYFLDLACGTGILTREIAKRFPNSKIIGIDITESYLDVARKNSNLFKNIIYMKQDAENLDLEEKFDCIVSSYIPKYCNSDLLVKNCIKHLNKKGGIILHDFTYPKNSIVKSLWSFYFVLLNFIGCVFVPNWKYAFSELPNLIKSSTWFSDYKNVMINNGLEVNYQYLTWNSSAILVGTKSYT